MRCQLNLTDLPPGLQVPKSNGPTKITGHDHLPIGGNANGRHPSSMSWAESRDAPTRCDIENVDNLVVTQRRQFLAIRRERQYLIP